MGAKGYLARRMLNFITGARSPPRLWLPQAETRGDVVADRLVSTESGDGGRSRVARKEGRCSQRERHRLMNVSLIG